MSLTGRPFPVTGPSDDGLVQRGPVDLLAVVVGGPLAAGFVDVHDCATEGAATVANRRFRIGLDARQVFGFGPVGARFDDGLVVVVSGACDVTVVWG